MAQQQKSSRPGKCSTTFTKTESRWFSDSSWLPLYCILTYFTQGVPISQRASFISFPAAVVGYSDKSSFRVKEFVLTHNSNVPCNQGSHDGWSLTEQATRPSQSRAQSNDLMHGQLHLASFLFLFFSYMVHDPFSQGMLPLTVDWSFFFD